ncbi:MAG: DMT family transporter [Bacillota bacterium]
MAWLYLFIAGILEVVWATAMKQAEGFTRPGWSALTIGAMIISFALLSMAMRSLPLGTAYATWTGIGAVGSVIVGILWLGEPRDLLRLLFVAMIIGGIIGLKVTSKAS